MTEQQSQIESSSTEASRQFTQQNVLDRLWDKFLKLAPVEIRGGAYWPQEDYPDEFVAQVMTADGPRIFRRATLQDAQSGELAHQRDRATEVGRRDDPPEIERAPGADFWGLVCGEAGDVQVRIEALHECMSSEPDRIIPYMAAELCREDVGDDWRDALIFAAEDAQFRDPLQRQAIKQRLLTLAKTLRGSQRLRDEHVVWSAMRTAASLMSPEESVDFLEFLGSPRHVDTRLVALQSLARVLESAPPAKAGADSPLANRVAELAEKFLDLDVLLPGENAAIAQNAILVLAAMGDPRVSRFVGAVKSLGRRWLIRQLSAKLQQLLGSWESRDDRSVPEHALELLKAQLADLKAWAIK